VAKIPDSKSPSEKSKGVKSFQAPGTELGRTVPREQPQGQYSVLADLQFAQTYLRPLLDAYARQKPPIWARSTNMGALMGIRTAEPQRVEVGAEISLRANIDIVVYAAVAGSAIVHGTWGQAR
jgi:hypothetical protein